MFVNIIFFQQIKIQITFKTLTLGTRSDINTNEREKYFFLVRLMSHKIRVKNILSELKPSMINDNNEFNEKSLCTLNTGKENFST